MNKRKTLIKVPPEAIIYELYNMSKLLFIITFLTTSLSLHGQLDQDFNSGDLGLWSGNVDDFIINPESQLQLMATDGGQSTIYTSVSFPDSLIWQISLELDFAPSTSNALDIWLAVDDLSNSLLNGYKLSIGETGSDDAIRFIKVANGTEDIIATGDMGQVAQAFSLDLELTKDAADNWRLSARQAGEGLYEEVLRVSVADDILMSLGSFGIDCKYTSTRTDKFYFDNILISELLPDTSAPGIVSAEVINDKKIFVQFDEAIDAMSAENSSNYSLGNNLNITSVTFDDEKPSEVCLILSESLPSGSTLLTISDIEDQNGNSLSSAEIEIAFAITPIVGDLVINEILYDPISGNDADFVEINNISDKYLKLDSCFFSRANSSANDVMIESGLIMNPGQIIAFTQDKTEIEEQYLPIPEANIIELNITNYVNDEGNVTLYSLASGTRTTLDSFDYSDDFHSTLLTESNKEGISLERLSPSGKTNDAENWFSASSLSNYGTPGYENSQRAVTAGDDQIELEHKIFSPDGDGYKDLMRLNYKLDKTGYIGNIAIYDDKGRLETHLAENKLLGTEGSVIWEGNLDDGSLAPIGMYIIYYDIFHADGEVISGKKVCVLAQQLN